MVKGNKNHDSQRDCEVKGIVVSRTEYNFRVQYITPNAFMKIQVYYSVSQFISEVAMVKLEQTWPFL